MSLRHLAIAGTAGSVNGACEYRAGARREHDRFVTRMRQSKLRQAGRGSCRTEPLVSP
jgi:hypothetical protein